MVHKPKHKVHSFRGLLGDGGQDEIHLERSNVNLAYRVIKFQIVTTAPGTVRVEHIVKIYREEQTSIDGVIDMSAILDAMWASTPLQTFFFVNDIDAMRAAIWNKEISEQKLVDLYNHFLI